MKQVAMTVYEQNVRKTVYEQVAMMTVYEKDVRMTVYEQVMTAYDEIFRISSVSVYCHARSNTIWLSTPAVARDLFSSPNRADRLCGTQEAGWVLSLG